MSIKNILKKTLITIALPAGMFLLMLIITRACGVDYYGSSDMWRTILTKLIYTIPMSCGIAMQLSNGRMDFSGGSTMILASIVGTSIAADYFGRSPYAMLIFCIVFGVIISEVTAAVYVTTKLPIIICTIGMALIYEALTLLVCGGNGVDILSDSTMNIFGRMPVGLFILAAAMILYYLVTNKTTVGRRGRLLSRGQSMAVNIGVNEKKNVMLIFLFSGILFGLGAAVYASQEKVTTQSELSTASILFKNIAAVYIGRFIGKASTEVIGIAMGALAVQLMNYGLNAVGYGSGGWDNIVFGIFMMSFWVAIAMSEAKKGSEVSF